MKSLEHPSFAPTFAKASAFVEAAADKTEGTANLQRPAPNIEVRP